MKASSLAPGPGLPVRWLAAVPLMLLSTTLPLFGLITFDAWWVESFEQWPDFQGSMFWTELSDDLDDFWGFLAVPAAALLVFLVERRTFAAWPSVCLWLAVWLVGPVLLFDIRPVESALAHLAVGAGLIWLTYGLGRLTVRVLSRPVARDVAMSSLEIPYRVPGSRARLRVRHDQLVLDRLRSTDRSVSKEIRWPELRDARLAELDEPMTWRASPDTWIEVPAGPVLHVTSANEEWRLPVTEDLGAGLAAAITQRAHDRT